MEVIYYRSKFGDDIKAYAVHWWTFLDDNGAGTCRDCNECYWLVPGTWEE